MGACGSKTASKTHEKQSALQADSIEIDVSEEPQPKSDPGPELKPKSQPDPEPEPEPEPLPEPAEKKEMSSWLFDVRGKYGEAPTSAGVKSRVFCFPHAGGDSTPLATKLSKLLPNHIQVLAVTYPGRGRRMSEDPISKFDVLVNKILAAMNPFITSTTSIPYVMLGHSLGCHVAFECATRIKAAGVCNPKLMVFSANCSPKSKVLPKDPVSKRDYDGVISHLRKLGGTPEEILAERDLMEMFMPCIRGDFSLSETYEYKGQTLDGPALVVGGEQDNFDLDSWSEIIPPDQITKKLFPGGHFYYDEHAESLKFICGFICESTASS